MGIKIVLTGYDKARNFWSCGYDYTQDKYLGQYKFFDSFVKDCKVDFSERFGVNIDSITVTRHIYPSVC